MHGEQPRFGKVYVLGRIDKYASVEKLAELRRSYGKQLLYAERLLELLARFKQDLGSVNSQRRLRASSYLVAEVVGST